METTKARPEGIAGKDAHFEPRAAESSGTPLGDFGLQMPAMPSSGLVLQQSLAATTGVMRKLEVTDALAVPALLLILWLAILFVSSRKGWRRFAAAYRAKRGPAGRRFTATSAGFGSGIAPYVSVIQVTFTAEGLYLNAPLHFRVFHRPFLVPWSSVRSIKRKERNFRPRYRIAIQDADAGELLLRLPGAIAADLASSRAARGRVGGNGAYSASS